MLLKDESVLKNLLQQEAKKKESVRLAESKIAKLNEQLQATEKILNANKVFLKKLQEQVNMIFLFNSYVNILVWQFLGHMQCLLDVFKA